MRYFTITEGTLDDVVSIIAGDRTDYQRNLKSHYARELERATNYDHHLVIFQQDGEWKEIRIQKEYSVDFVMKHHFE